MSSATTASKAGAKVILLEKAPEGQEGGSTGTCGGGTRTFTNAADAAAYFKALCFGTTPDDVTAAMAKELVSETFVANMKAAGVDRVSRKNIGVPAFPTLPGAKSDYGDWDIVNDKGERTNGRGLFAVLKSSVIKQGVTVKYSTLGKELVQHPSTKEILGVVAEEQGKKVYVKAKRGVVLTLGGFEANYEMQGNFLFPGLKIYPIGTPYSTGDGIKMVADVGAPLWHTTSFEWAPLGIKPASEALGCSVGFAPGAFGDYVFVNRRGQRFMNEALGLTYNKGTLALTNFDHDKAEYPNMPVYLIGDKLTQTLGVGTWGENQTWYRLHTDYKWSADNSAEIAKGWIIKADTLADLAAKLKMDPTALQDTVKKFNGYCQAGEDTEFKRPRSGLTPLGTPPFYAVELNLAFVNTHGGPKRNAKAQILNKDDKPIARLYSAGEFGSIWGHLGPHGWSLGENFGFGRIAGVNVAAEKPWDAAL